MSTPSPASRTRAVAVCAGLVLGLGSGLEAAQHYYVAPTGVYGAAGTVSEPTTLEGARDKIRGLGSIPAGGVLVYLRGGDYVRTTSFVLGSSDSGTADRPVTYRSFPGERARLVGGPGLDPAWFTLVANGSAAWSRLPAAARGQTYVVDLPAHGITDLGTLVRRGFSTSTARSALELAFDGAMMTLARWPNADANVALDGGAAIVSNPTPTSQTISPDVTGTYDSLGTSAAGNADDGFPNYRRSGLVDGVQYYLYHCTWANGRNRYWFISRHSPQADANCWPTDGPSWAVSGDVPERIQPMGPLGGSAVGTLLSQTQAVGDPYHGFVAIPDRVSATQFHFPGARSQSWSGAAGLWVQGLIGNYWADDTLPVTIDSDGLATLGASPSYALLPGQPFFVLNLLEELDQPGEWYLDRATGLLYLWPPGPLAGARIQVSVLAGALIQASGLRFVSFEDLDLELTRGLLVQITGAEAVRLRYCALRGSGSDAVAISGTASGVEHSTILESGAAGVVLDGGSRPSLTEAGNYVRDSEIARWGRWERTYRSAVRVDGCGQIVEHNDLHDNPHSAIRFTGNEHRLRYNRIWDVTKATNDAGAIYTGRDWGYRGTTISDNFIHHVESIFGGSHGIYLDDAASGMQVTGNILYRIRGLATFNGGGRDNVFANNVIVDAIGTHSADRRARTSNYNFAGNGRPDSWNLLGRINVVYETYSQDYPNVQAIDYQSGAWAAHYPALAEIPNDWPQVQATHWQDPEGNVFSRNVSWRSNPGMVEGTWGGSGAYDSYAEIADNLDADPMFVDEASLDLALRPESPAFAIPGFQDIPFAQIGIRPPTRRALTVGVVGSGAVASVVGGIDCGQACQAWFDDGATVTLRATAGPGESFAGWGGGCTGTGDCVVALTQDKTVAAVFGSVASPEIAVDDASVSEGSSGTQEISIRVRLSTPATSPP